MKFQQQTNLIIQAFYEVYNKLGIGFDKQVYINAFEIKLKALNLKVEKNATLEILFEAKLIGTLIVDLLVDNNIILSIQNLKQIDKNSEQILFNHLKATEFQVGLIFNFGSNPEFKRKDNLIAKGSLDQLIN